jgi:hypothetical protein
LQQCLPGNDTRGGRVEVVEGLPEQTAVVLSAKPAPAVGTAVQSSMTGDKS